MTRLVLDHNPLSKETVFFDFDNHTNEVRITHEQDVSTFLDRAHELSSDGERTRKGIKNDFWHYAHVPNVVIMDMAQKHGVDFFDRAQSAKVFRLLNTEYKRTKVTNLTHEVKNG